MTADSNRGRGSVLAYAAAAWASLFAVLHGVWAAGWYIGLQADEARRAFERPGFLAFDIIVAGMCTLAAAVALALVRPWGRRVPRWLVGLLAWGATGLLALRGGTAAIQVLYMIISGTFAAHWMLLWEVWFCLGAVLFGLSAWRFWTVPPTSSVTV